MDYERTGYGDCPWSVMYVAASVGSNAARIDAACELYDRAADSKCDYKISAAMLTAMRSADSLTESRARCAYRAVVSTLR